MTRLPLLSLALLAALSACSRTELLFCNATTAPCPKNFTCVAQRCVPGEPSNDCTVAGQVKCTDTCVDLLADPMNCGACNRACSTGQACEAGSCVSTCSMGLTNCQG